MDRSYRPDIDGMRAIAILSVVCYHGALPWLSGGFTGVDIFFVISGYLIGGHIYTELVAKRFSYMRFYQRRAKRILPAFYGVLSFTILASILLLSPSEAMEFGRSAFAATLSGSNLIFWHYSGYFAAKSELNPLLMTWSLGVEEQFYVVIPLAMVLLARIRRRSILPVILLICSISFVLSVVALNRYPSLVFYLLPTRAWELGAGVVLAMLEVDRARTLLKGRLAQVLGFVGLALVFAPILLLNSRSHFPGWNAFPSVLGTTVLIAVPSSWICRRLLSFGPLVFIGKISYSLYLWHWPFLSFLRVTSGGSLPRRGALAAIVAAFVAAILSYYIVEQPFRRSKRAPAPLLLRYALVSLLMIGACSAVWVSRGFPSRRPALAQMDDAATSQIESDPCLAQHDGMPSAERCYGAHDAQRLVAIWGDSHSAALAPGLRPIASQQGYGVMQLGHISCLPLIGAANYQPRSPVGAQQCMDFNNHVMALLQSDSRVKLVVLAGEWTDSFQPGDGDGWIVTDPLHPLRRMPDAEAAAIFRKALSQAVTALEQSGKQVIVMEDVPTFAFDPILKVRTTSIPARRALARWMGNDPGEAYYGPINMPGSVEAADSQLRLAVQSFPGVQLVDLRTQFCLSDSACYYRSGAGIFYSDPDHLTAYGARYALRNFRFPAVAIPRA